MDNVKREEQDGKANHPESDEKQEPETNTVFEQIPGSLPAIRKVISYEIKWKGNKKKEKKSTVKDRQRGKKKRSKESVSPSLDSPGITDDGLSTCEDSTRESPELKVKKGSLIKKDRRKGEKKNSAIEHATQEAEPVSRKSDHLMAYEAMRFIKKTQFLETALTTEQNALIRKYFEDDSKKPTTDVIDSLIGAFNLCCIRLQQVEIGDPLVDPEVRAFCKDKETAKVKLLDAMLENMNELQPQCWKTQEKSIIGAVEHKHKKEKEKSSDSLELAPASKQSSIEKKKQKEEAMVPRKKQSFDSNWTPLVAATMSNNRSTPPSKKKETPVPPTQALSPSPAQSVQQSSGSAPSLSPPAKSQLQKPGRTKPHSKMKKQNHKGKNQNATVLQNPPSLDSKETTKD